MSETALSRLKTRLNDYQNHISENRAQLSGLGSTPGRVRVQQEIEDLEVRVVDLREIIQDLEKEYAEIEQIKAKIKEDQEEAEGKKRLLGMDPKGWFDSQKSSIEDSWVKLEEERARLAEDREEIRTKVAKINLEEEKRKALKNEIKLWAQNMLVFVAILAAAYFLQNVVPGDYKMPFGISMLIFSVFPLVAVIITAYNIYRY